MKKITLFLISIIIFQIGKSQILPDILIDFEDPSTINMVQIDSISNPNNIWQIGQPNKSFFDTAYSIPNCILTDSINFYPINDTSSFIIKHHANLGFHNNVVEFGIWYKVDTDSITDFGRIEFSPNNGQIWIDLLEDTAILPNHVWYDEKPVFSGKSSGWKCCGLNLGFFGTIYPNIVGDTVHFKFTFISDSIQSNKEGWLIDNIHIVECVGGIYENNFEIVQSNAFPNPVMNELTIDFKNQESNDYKLTIFDNIGREYKILDKIKSNTIKVNVKNMNPGLYFYRLIDYKKSKIAIGRFIKIN